MRDVNYCGMLFFSVWGEHSETHRWLCTRDGWCASQKLVEEWPWSR